MEKILLKMYENKKAVSLAFPKLAACILSAKND
jgi:hypothetical protein